MDFRLHENSFKNKRNSLKKFLNEIFREWLLVYAYECEYIPIGWYYNTCKCVCYMCVHIIRWPFFSAFSSLQICSEQSVILKF